MIRSRDPRTRKAQDWRHNRRPGRARAALAPVAAVELTASAIVWTATTRYARHAA